MSSDFVILSRLVATRLQILHMCLIHGFRTASSKCLSAYTKPQFSVSKHYEYEIVSQGKYDMCRSC